MPNTLAVKDSSCEQSGCWASTAGRALFCMSHLKQNEQKIMKLYKNIYRRICSVDRLNWSKFI